MPLGTKVGLVPGDIVLDEDPAPLRKGHSSPPPHFSAHVYCGETVVHLSSCCAELMTVCSSVIADLPSACSVHNLRAE